MIIAIIGIIALLLFQFARLGSETIRHLSAGFVFLLGLFSVFFGGEFGPFFGAALSGWSIYLFLVNDNKIQRLISFVVLGLFQVLFISWSWKIQTLQAVVWAWSVLLILGALAEAAVALSLENALRRLKTQSVFILFQFFCFLVFLFRFERGSESEFYWVFVFGISAFVLIRNSIETTPKTDSEKFIRMQNQFLQGLLVVVMAKVLVKSGLTAKSAVLQHSSQLALVLFSVLAAAVSLTSKNPLSWFARTWASTSLWGAAVVLFADDSLLALVTWCGALFGALGLGYHLLRGPSRFLALVSGPGLPWSPLTFLMIVVSVRFYENGEFGILQVAGFSLVWIVSVWASIRVSKTSLLMEELDPPRIPLNRQGAQRVILVCLIILQLLLFAFVELRTAIFTKAAFVSRDIIQHKA